MDLTQQTTPEHGESGESPPRIWLSDIGRDWHEVKHSQDLDHPTLSAPRETGIERADKDDKTIMMLI